MSFVKNLAKIAVGVAIAKGVNEYAKSRAGQGSILDGLNKAGTGPTTATAGKRGGLEEMLGHVLSGRGGGAVGGLGGLLESLSGASRPKGGTAQAGTTQAGIPPAGTPPEKGSLGDLLNQSFGRYGEPETAPSRQAEDDAALLMRAMIMAAKVDGRIDPGEKKRLLDQLDDATPQVMAFIEEQLRAPVDPQALAAEAPPGKRAQVYLMSIMAVDIDSPSERAYLHDLATALGLEPATVAAIHDRLGVPKPA